MDNLCTKCVANFELINGTCYERINISNCNVVDFANKKCSSCATRYYPESNRCQAFPTSCSKFNETSRKCIECDRQFTLNAASQCILRPPIVTAPNNTTPQPVNTSAPTPTSSGITILPQSGSSDLNCRQFSGSQCRSCSSRFYVGAEGRCLAVNPLCRDHNPAGECTSCYQGYAVQMGRCIVAQSGDPNCRKL